MQFRRFFRFRIISDSCYKCHKGSCVKNAKFPDGVEILANLKLDMQQHSWQRFKKYPYYDWDNFEY